MAVFEAKLRENQSFGRGGQNRTADLLVPNQAPCRWATPRICWRTARRSPALGAIPFALPFLEKGRGASCLALLVPPERIELSSLAPEASTLIR